MSKWSEDWFWFCDKCGAIAPRLDIIESEFQLFDDSRATHKNCGGHVYVLNPGEYNTFPTVEALKSLPDDERRIAMQHIQEFVSGRCSLAAENIRAREALRNGPRCPKCGSLNFVEISTASRLISVAAWGLASGKIGKQYECKNCRHKW